MVREGTKLTFCFVIVTEDANLKPTKFVAYWYSLFDARHLQVSRSVFNVRSFNFSSTHRALNYIAESCHLRVQILIWQLDRSIFDGNVCGVCVYLPREPFAVFQLDSIFDQLLFRFLAS